MDGFLVWTASLAAGPFQISLAIVNLLSLLTRSEPIQKTPKDFMSNRKEKIEAMLAESPEDVFLRYSLAMELRKEGESARCTELFQGLIEDTPPHVPAFLMFGQYYAENDRVEDARSILRIGIEEARNQNESHAAGEMGELLGALGDS